MKEKKKNTYCENKYCAFYQNETCIFESVNHDNLGICEEMVIMNIDEKIIEEKRKEVLQRYLVD